MRVLAVLLTVVAVTAHAYVAPLVASTAVFASWKAEHGKSYTNVVEEAARFAIFQQNVAKINALNAGHQDGMAFYGLDRFSDLSEQEFAEMYLTYRHPKQPVKADVLPARVSNSTGIDWRTRGAVTKVKDQKSCGSCWAMSMVQEVESMWFLSNGTLTELSVQQVVSCDKGIVSWGCKGGTTQFAYEYAIFVKGLVSEADFPYTAASHGICKYDPKRIVATLSRWVYAVPMCLDIVCNNQDEARLKAAVATVGPVSVCLNAGPFHSYKGGILTGDKCKHDLLMVSHCVQVVGFNATEPMPYWIVRNSWGAAWGNEGYIYLEMGKNTCGIANIATIAVI